jgi:hypothetical protein
VRVGTGFIWLRKEPNGGSLLTKLLAPEFLKSKGFSFCGLNYDFVNI